MLKQIAPPESALVRGNYAIVAASYNREYVDALVEAATNELKGADQVQVVRVPGAFEIPAVAARLASGVSPNFDAIICFGVILQGKTSHAQNIAESVSNALAMLQVQTQMPIIHGVLHFENEEQARVRCFGTEHNRGIEAARTAIKMAQVFRELDGLENQTDIGLRPPLL
jgi:6,7-dimethyl-8-ribityllumazine synthase